LLSEEGTNFDFSNNLWYALIDRDLGSLTEITF